MISMEILNIINTKAPYFKTSMFIDDSCIIEVWFVKLAEILR